MLRDILSLRYVVDDEYNGSGGAKFPIKWAAPEVLNFMRFSSKSDVWAFGVLMWEVYTCGKMPYGKMRNNEVVEMVQSGGILEKPRYCPDYVYSVSTFWHVLYDIIQKNFIYNLILIQRVVYISTA